MEPNRRSRLAALYAGTVFVSAFLLFQIQPLISRYILPWFGGSPAVWTTCLVFFQTLLFGGYLYAHLSEHYFGPRLRSIVHLALITAALLTLPVTPSDWWKPTSGDHPSTKILALLSICVGLPYFVLSSTGPLVQAWFSQTLPGRSPYRLYSLSNLGSLLALLSYPFVVEPLLDGHEQSWWWTGGFVLFALLSAIACLQTARLRSALPVATETQADDAPAPPWLHRLLWLLLPAFASAMLLATTNHLCEDIPPVPFLWIAPLSLYLLSFIICFDHQRWYWRLPYALAALLVTYALAVSHNPMAWGRWLPSEPNLRPRSALFWLSYVSAWQIMALQLAGMFLLAMLCHGELVRLRPKSSRWLTSFYLMISAGGALGGLSISLVAPLVFKTYAEWKIGLVVGFVLSALVAFVLAEFSSLRRTSLRTQRLIRAGGIVVALLALPDIFYMMWHDTDPKERVLARTRNFYGILKVLEEQPSDPETSSRVLVNGNTVHGLQMRNPDKRLFPSSYYTAATGMGHALQFFKQAAAESGRPLRIGAVGLGVGTLAAYVDSPEQTVRFYEIDSDVCRLAEEYFTYLSDARARQARVEIVLGDARLSLERELDRPQAFDLLVIDAFSGDSIPVHLLTKEAFAIYSQQLAPGGAIAVHISSRYLDLAPLIYGLAQEIGFVPLSFSTPDTTKICLAAYWVIVTQNQELLESLRADKGNLATRFPTPPFPVWTDQKHNLLEVLKKPGDKPRAALPD